MSKRYQVYSVVVNWVTGSKPYMPLVEGILGAHGDWLRVVNCSWLCYSGDDARTIASHIMAALPNETVLVLKVEKDDAWGFAPQWVWQWLFARFDGVAEPGTIAPPTTPTALPYKT